MRARSLPLRDTGIVSDVDDRVLPDGNGCGDGTSWVHGEHPRTSNHQVCRLMASAGIVLTGNGCDLGTGN